MRAADVTDPGAVLQAIQEYDALGREGFLARYGFGQARRYLVRHNGHEYDSKALLAAAHGYQYPEQGPLRSVQLKGGHETISKLRSLGFEIDSGPDEASDTVPNVPGPRTERPVDGPEQVISSASVEALSVAAEPPSDDFTFSALRKTASTLPYNLELDDDVYLAVTAAIRSGKHIILTGPPGTAKTTLAEATCQLGSAVGLCNGYKLTTATADWTTHETIGGLRPAKSGNGLEFHRGHFLDAAASGHWLIVDELNRSNFDRAFGQLFTLLSGQSVVLPYDDSETGLPIALILGDRDRNYRASEYAVTHISRNWRIIATMNVFDKSLLFEMSYALMRRFAFIEVPSPDESTFQKIWHGEVVGLDEKSRRRLDTILGNFLKLRGDRDMGRDIGPAVFKDMAKFAAEYLGAAPQADDRSLSFQLFYSYLLPQYEGIDNQTGQRLFRWLQPIVGDQHDERLKVILKAVLGVSVSTSGSDTEEDFELGLPDLTGQG